MVGVEVGRIYGDVMTDECDAGRTFLDFFYRGLITIYEDDGNVSAVYVILPADNDDVAFHHPRFHRVAADFYLFLSPNRSHKKPNNPPIIEKATATAIAVKIPNDHTA